MRVVNKNNAIACKAVSGYALHIFAGNRIPINRKRTIYLLQSRTVLFTADTCTKILLRSASALATMNAYNPHVSDVGCGASSEALAFWGNDAHNDLC